MTAPGSLNRRLVLEAPVEAADDQGGVVRSYAAVATLWAEIAPLRAHPGVVADALGADVSHRIVLRGNFSVTTRHRLRDGGVIYRIVAFRARDAGRFIEIDAELRIE